MSNWLLIFQSRVGREQHRQKCTNHALMSYARRALTAHTGSRGASQTAAPGSCEPPSAGGTTDSCARRRRRRSLSALVIVMGWSGKNPARPARRNAERRGPTPPPFHRPAPTQELLGRPRQLRAAAQPMPQALQVEPRHLLAVGVGQRVEAAELLQVLPVPGAFAVRRYDAVEGPVGAAAEGETDHDVSASIALQKAAPCGESARRSRAAPSPAGCARGHSPSCTMAAAPPAVAERLRTSGETGNGRRTALTQTGTRLTSGRSAASGGPEPRGLSGGAACVLCLGRGLLCAATRSAAWGEPPELKVSPRTAAESSAPPPRFMVVSLLIS